MATTISGNTVTTENVVSDSIKLDGSNVTLYEDGTWTPIINSGMTSNVLTGSYTRVGKWVTVHFKGINLAQGTAPSEYFNITGLPYTVDDFGKRYSGSFGELYTIGISNSTTSVAIPATEGGGIRLFAFNHDAGADSRALTTAFNGDYLQLQLTYRTNDV